MRVGRAPSFRLHDEVVTDEAGERGRTLSGDADAPLAAVLQRLDSRLEEGKSGLRISRAPGRARYRERLASSAYVCVGA